MGQVWLAEDVRLLRRVAVKILPEDLASDAIWKARFLHEARTAARLNHPGIAAIYAVAEEGATMYIAMELVEGKSLAEMISSGSASQSELVGIVRDVARALAAAHEAGIIHRDIKPENIIVSPRGAKVVDFGLAKDLPVSFSAGGPALTAANTLLGTPQYMSPEQALAQPLDARSDIFSLGVVLYEVLDGRLPFAGSSLTDTLIRIVTHSHPTLKDGPPALAAIVDRCLEKKRERRYASMTALGDALDAFLGEIPAAPMIARNQETMALGVPAIRSERALIIDDDPVCRLLVRTCLEQEGYRWDEAENGAEGMRRLRDEDYGIVFLDIRMPRADGWSVLDFVRSRERPPRHLVIMTSIRDLKLSEADQRPRRVKLANDFESAAVREVEIDHHGRPLPLGHVPQRLRHAAHHHRLGARLPEGRAKDPLRQRIVLDHEDAGAGRGVHAPHAAAAAKLCTSDCRLSEDNGLCSSRVTIR